MQFIGQWFSISCPLQVQVVLWMSMSMILYSTVNYIYKNTVIMYRTYDVLIIITI